jgi:hypothetical protein
VIATAVMAIEEHNASMYKLEVHGKHKLAKFALCCLIFYRENGGSMFLYNTGILQIIYRTSYTKRQLSVCLTYIENQYLPVCYYHHVTGLEVAGKARRWRAEPGLLDLTLHRLDDCRMVVGTDGLVAEIVCHVVDGERGAIW